jgi:ribosome-binding factor A
MSKRTRQVAERIQHILGTTIQNELKDPRVGFTTVVAVEVSSDLQHARVSVSVMGTPEEQRDTMHALQRARGFLRRRVAEELKHLRSVPELSLHLDTSLDYSLRINELLREVQEERKTNPPDLSDE